MAKFDDKECGHPIAGQVLVACCGFFVADGYELKDVLTLVQRVWFGYYGVGDDLDIEFFFFFDRTIIHYRKYLTLDEFLEMVGEVFLEIERMARLIEEQSDGD